MRWIKLLLPLALVVTSLSVAPGAEAAAAIPIGDCPFIANEPGRTYHVTTNLTCAGRAIKVTAPNVAIDLRGHTLTGTPSGDPTLFGGVVFEFSGGRGTLRNGTIQEFDDSGVLMNSSSAVTISNIRALNNGSIGFQLHGNAPKLLNSVAAGNGGAGVDIVAFGDPSLVSGTTVVRNNGAGIVVANSAAPRIVGSTITANTGIGVDIAGAETAVLRGSRVVGNGDSQFEQGVRITGDVAKIEANEVSANAHEGIHADTGRAVLNDNRTEGNGWAVPDTLGTGIFTTGSASGSGNISRGNEGSSPQCVPTTLCSSGARNVPAKKNPIVLTVADCGTALNQPGRIYTITADVICPANGFAISADKVTLDLGGHTLSNSTPALDNGFGVFLAPTGVQTARVQNGTLLRWRGGIETNAGPSDLYRLTISNLALVDNGQAGVVLWDAAISASRSSALTNGSTGIAAVGKASRVTNTTLGGNAGAGLNLASSKAVVRKVRSLGNGDAADERGVSITGDSPVVESSTVSGNADHGIYNEAVSLAGVRNPAVIDGNRANGNGWAVEDGLGLGIKVIEDRGSGRNVARGNDDPLECDPGNLC